jgi:hypothetical protein
MFALLRNPYFGECWHQMGCIHWAAFIWMSRRRSAASERHASENFAGPREDRLLRAAAYRSIAETHLTASTGFGMPQATKTPFAENHAIGLRSFNARTKPVSSPESAFRK